MRGTGSRLGRRPLRRPGGMAQGKLRTDPGQQGNLECRGREHAAGCRGFRPASTLPQLLARRRGARNRKGLPPLRTERILAWADAWFAAKGKWPRQNSGPIPGTKETWSAVVAAMRRAIAACGAAFLGPIAGPAARGPESQTSSAADAEADSRLGAEFFQDRSPLAEQSKRADRSIARRYVADDRRRTAEGKPRIAGRIQPGKAAAASTA